jgi:hypothetical protein
MAAMAKVSMPGTSAPVELIFSKYNSPWPFFTLIQNKPTETVFTFDDLVDHRSSEEFVVNITCARPAPTSGKRRNNRGKQW